MIYLSILQSNVEAACASKNINVGFLLRNKKATEAVFVFAGTLKVYFVILEVQNNNDRDIRLMWTYNNKERDIIVEGRSVVTLSLNVSTSTYPFPIGFEASDVKNRSLVLLRERKKLLLVPRRERIKEVVIIGMAFCCIFP